MPRTLHGQTVDDPAVAGERPRPRWTGSLRLLVLDTVAADQAVAAHDRTHAIRAGLGLLTLDRRALLLRRTRLRDPVGPAASASGRSRHTGGR
jgi:hypothetical protein